VDHFLFGENNRSKSACTKVSVSDLESSGLAGYCRLIRPNLCTRHIRKDLTPRGHHDWPYKPTMRPESHVSVHWTSKVRWMIIAGPNESVGARARARSVCLHCPPTAMMSYHDPEMGCCWSTGAAGVFSARRCRESIGGVSAIWQTADKDGIARITSDDLVLKELTPREHHAWPERDYPSQWITSCLPTTQELRRCEKFAQVLGPSGRTDDDKASIRAPRTSRDCPCESVVTSKT
jgi:hypothetical protein